MAVAPQAQQGPTPQTAYRAGFSAGELAPALHYRVDLSKWHGGAALLRNFFVESQGSASNRPGTEFIGEAKFPDLLTRLIKFTFNPQQTYVIEAGSGYFRFISDGAYLSNPDGSVYEIATPYASAELATIRYAQSADVLSLAHNNHPPMELRRLGQLEWQLAPVVIGSQMAAPQNVSVAATLAMASQAQTNPPLAVLTFTYAVTAVSIINADQSPLSAAVTTNNFDLGYYGQYGNYNSISWSVVPGADYYNIFRLYQGVWSFIASTQALSLQDTNVLPDTSNTPPQFQNPLSASPPGAVGYYQQRRVYAGSSNNPQTIWFSKSGNYTNFDVSQPTRDDDAITLTIAAQQVNVIKHFVALSDLVVMTSAGAWKITSSTNATLTPSSAQVIPQTYAGSADIQPIVINYDVLYVEEKGSAVRDLTYNFYANVYTGTDISVMANHLFLGKSILQWDYAQTPFKLVWAVRSDGALLCLSYLKEQDIYAWSQHDTMDGVFLSVAVVSEYQGAIGEDRPYFVVQRTIAGETVVYIERMASRLLGVNNDDVTQAWFVDAGLRYTGAPVSTVSGLQHLEGQIVSIMADGDVAPQAVVRGGAVSLPQPASTVTVGLPIQAQMRTLPLDAGQPTMLGRRKRISKVRLMVQNTRGLKVGTNGQQLIEVKERSTEPYGVATRLQTGSEFAWNPGKWDIPGQVLIQQDNPLPATVLGVLAEFEDGI